MGGTKPGTLAGTAYAPGANAASGTGAGHRFARWRMLAGWIACLAVLLAMPIIVGESYLFLCANFLIMALFAMSYNLLFGKAGMLSFGHAAYYGIGAYTVAILGDKLSVGILTGLLVAPVAAAAAALAVGFFTVRLSGMYFAMLTLAFGQLIYTVVFGWYDFTGGDNGLPVAMPEWLLSATHFYYLTLAVVAVAVSVLRIISASAFGAALGAIRENPQRAAFIGLNVRMYQLAAFVIAGAFAGIAGGLRAPLEQMAFPSLLYWTQSADPVLMALAGGIGTFVGPIVGAAVFTFVNFAVTSYTDYPLLAFGLLVLLIVLFLPGGVAGAAEAAWRRLRTKRDEGGAR